MPYNIKATSDTPMFIVYLIDLSGSMALECGGKRRIDVVASSLERIRRKMIARSRVGDEVKSRYAVAMLGYSDNVVDLLNGIQTIDKLETMQLPTLNPGGSTNTGAAFEAAWHVLNQYLPNIQDCPAPLVCHLTDGGANVGSKPDQIATSIKQLGTSDGTVLVENIYIGERLLKYPIEDPKRWPGVLNPADIQDPYVQALWHSASPLPDSYAAELNETEDYRIQPGSKMLIPAEAPEMIELAFQMSGSTPRGRG